MGTQLLIKELKKIFFFKGDLELFQEFMIFLFKAYSLMSSFLVHYVFNYSVNMWMWIGKNSITFLPVKSAFNPLLLCYKLIALNLDFFYKSDINTDGLNPTNTCAWSGMQWIASIFALRACTRDVIYLCNSSLCSFGIRLCLPWTANTNCK